MKQRRRDLIKQSGGHQPQSDPTPSPEAEWQALATFMKQHAPNLWQRFEHVPENAPMHERMKRSMLDRHRDLARLEQRDPQQYQREVRQVEVEDEIIGIGRQLWAGPSDGKADELKSKLRERIRALFDLRFKTREERIARLADMLAKERAKLEAEKRDVEASVQRRYDAVLNRKMEGSPLGPPGGPGRPGGPPPPRVREQERRREESGPPVGDGGSKRD